MRLITFSAKNFKNLENLSIDFSNYNLISGDNGSGKSSILQGITYCLTDKLSEKLSEYVSWGKDYFELSLSFEHQKDIYDYSVRYSGSTKKELKINSSEFYRGGEAAAKINSIINSELLMYSSISEQGQSYSILLESPSERLKKFKTILGVDKLANVVEICKKEISEKKSEIDRLKTEVQILSNKQFSYLEEFDLPNIDSISQSLTEQETQKDIALRNKELLNRFQQDQVAYKKEVEKQSSTITELQSKESQFSNIGSANFDETLFSTLLLKKKEYDSLLTEYSSKKQNRLTYINRLETLKNKKTSVEEKKNSVKIYRVASLDFDDKYLKNLNEEIQNLSVKLKQLQAHEKLAKEGKCPSCGQDFKHDPSKLSSEIQETKALLDTLKGEHEIKKSSLEDYEKKTFENSKNKEIIANYEEDLKATSKELEELAEVPEPELASYDTDFLKSLASLEVQKIEYEKNKLLIERLKKEIDGLKFEISRFSKIEQPIEPAYEKENFNIDLYESLKKELNIYEEKKDRLRSILEHNKKTKLEEENNKNEIKQKESVYYNLVGDMSVLEEAKAVIEKKFASFLIEKGTTFVESQMNKFFQICYNKYTVFFKQTENKNSIDFYYSDEESGKLASASLCSGFEKQLLSIAFRVALASITGLGFLILDEIDSDASEENSINLYSNLISSGLFNQIIAISHKEETKAYLINNHQTQLIKLGES